MLGHRVHAEELEFLLVIFPYHIQLAEPAYLSPQRRLTEHAQRHGIAVLDLAGTFRDLIYDAQVVATLRKDGRTSKEIPSTACTLPKRFLSPRTSIIAPPAILRLCHRCTFNGPGGALSITFERMAEDRGRPASRGG